MMDKEKLIKRLEIIAYDKKLAMLSIKEEALSLSDVHSVLRMKSHIDYWIELNFESNILYNIIFND